MPALALLRKTTREALTVKHRHVARKLVLKVSWVRRNFSTLVGQMKANAKLLTKRTVQKITGFTIVHDGMKSGAKYPRGMQKWEQKATTSKKEWKWQSDIVTYPLSESQRNKSHSSMKQWEFDLPAEGFLSHVATDGFLLGIAGKWAPYGSSVVQSDFDGELGPVYGMYGTMDAYLEVQRTIKRTELTRQKRDQN